MNVIVNNILIILIAFLFLASCDDNEQEIESTTQTEMTEYKTLPIRDGERPATTSNIPHVQLDLDLVQDVHEEMIRRIYTIPGIEEKPSAILSWQGLWISESVTIVQTEAVISGRELGHVHDDGSLHIYLEPQRATEAIEAGWAVSHPFAVQGQAGWEGFVMLYTPQSIEELNVTFQLIVDAYNYVTEQDIVATDYYN